MWLIQTIWVLNFQLGSGLVLILTLGTMLKESAHLGILFVKEFRFERAYT
jgi:hypothetical protein